jgi:hypothetical protein
MNTSKNTPIKEYQYVTTSDKPTIFHSTGLGLTIGGVLIIGLIACIILHKFKKD